MSQDPRGEISELLEQLSHTGDGVLAIDTHHRIILWNQAAEALLGFSADEVSGKLCHEILHGCDSSGKMVCSVRCSEFRKARRNQWPSDRKILARARDGGTLRIDVSTLALFSPQKKLTSLVHLIRKDSQDPQPHTFLTESEKAPFPPVQPVPAVAEEPAHACLLSTREVTVLQHLAAGHSTRVIAQTLSIRVVTVRNHVQSILRKLGAHSRLEAVAVASRRNWI